MEPISNKRQARNRLVWALLYLAAFILVLSTLFRATDQFQIIVRVLLAALFGYRVYQFGTAWYRLRKGGQ